jgi:hypothetical protein
MLIAMRTERVLLLVEAVEVAAHLPVCGIS